MPSKRIIILEKRGPATFRYVMWADVPVARQAFYANAAAKSQWKDASAPETAALQSGAVVERTDETNFAAGLSAAQMQTALENTWADYQAYVNAFNPWAQYGRFWQGDGSAWVAGGVS